MRAVLGRPRAPRLAGAILAVGLGLAVPGRGAAFQILDLGADSLATDGLEAMRAGDRRHATRLFTQLVEANPDAPGALLLRLKLECWGIVEGRDSNGDLERRLDADFARLQVLAEARLEREPHDVEALFALGEAHCTVGRLEGIRGHAWSTLRQHRSGIGLLRAALDVRPDLAAPLASLGICHYYAARLPAGLRFLGRFLHLQADRDAGLRELWRAARAPGVQQTEAAFFLLEILNTAEDENLEALPLALEFHARYPHDIGFATKLADIYAGLERPDLAVRLLERCVADSAAAPNAVPARFFLARAYALSDRVEEAARLLESLTPEQMASVTWLAGWRALHLGGCYAVLGRGAEAEAQFAAAATAPDLAGCRDLAHREAALAADSLYLLTRRAAGILAWGGEPAASRALLEPGLRRFADAPERTLAGARYTLGRAALRQGDFAAAARFCEAAVAHDEGEEVTLVTGPRVRLLQALLWSGRLDEARLWAERFRPGLGRWGTNEHLALLVQTCLEPAGSPPAPFVVASLRSPGGPPARFHLEDAGFTSVALQRRGAPRPEPMRMRAGHWQLDVPLPRGDCLYVFLVEGRYRLLDPESEEIRSSDALPWSLRRSAGDAQS